VRGVVDGPRDAFRDDSPAGGHHGESADAALSYAMARARELIRSKSPCTRVLTVLRVRKFAPYDCRAASVQPGAGCRGTSTLATSDTPFGAIDAPRSRIQ